MTAEETLEEALGECADLLDVLLDVLKKHGPEPFLTWPIITTSPQHFPQESGPEVDRVAAIISRLARLAGLSAVPLRLEDHRPDDDVASIHQQPVVSFIGIDGDVAVFSLECLGAPDLLIATLCHEVALFAGERRTPKHPYRSTQTDTAPFETDDLIRAAVTTVVLGWGAITANGAHRFAKTGVIQGYSVRSEWSHGRVGALSAGDLCCLLALQAVVRDDELDGASFVETLQENQRIELEGWYDVLLPHREELCRRLAMPVEPPPRGDESEQRDREGDPRMTIVRRPIHRVRRNRTGEHGVVGALVGCGFLVALLLASIDSDALLVAFGLPVVGAVVGALIGRRRPKLFCSAWDCGAILDQGTKHCLKCGGAVESDITVRELDELRASKGERFDELAEAEYDAEPDDDDEPVDDDV